jgi:hypothetical protein
MIETKRTEGKTTAVMTTETGRPTAEGIFVAKGMAPGKGALLSTAEVTITPANTAPGGALPPFGPGGGRVLFRPMRECPGHYFGRGGTGMPGDPDPRGEQTPAPVRRGTAGHPVVPLRALSVPGPLSPTGGGSDPGASPEKADLDLDLEKNPDWDRVLDGDYWWDETDDAMPEPGFGDGTGDDDDDDDWEDGDDDIEEDDDDDDIEEDDDDDIEEDDDDDIEEDGDDDFEEDDDDFEEVGEDGDPDADDVMVLWDLPGEGPENNGEDA